MMDFSSASSEGEQILLIGNFSFTTETLQSLSTLGQLLELDGGDRKSFLNACRSGQYDRVSVIVRTFESIALTGPFDSELIEALPNSVKFIAHNGVGYDQINVSRCAAKGILVSNTPGVANDSTANTAMILVLNTLHHTHAYSSSLRAGKWRENCELGRDPKGLTLGIIGMGDIGSSLALRALPFGFKIQYHNRQPVVPQKNLAKADYVTLEELLKTSDVISIHIPLSDDTQQFIDSEKINMMKDGVVIINTSRGQIIDEKALTKKLIDGKVGAAGLDVFAEEPEVSQELRESTNTFLLPHTGTATHGTMEKMKYLTFENIQCAMKNGILKTPVPEHRKIQTLKIETSETNKRPV